MYKKMTFSLSVLAITLTVSCATLGNQFDVSRIGDIQQCSTTEAELVSMFGEPYRRGSHDGMPTMQWAYAKAGLGGAESETLLVVLNEEGRVSQYQWNPVTLMLTSDVTDKCAEPEE